jgi:hypothetical protein
VWKESRIKEREILKCSCSQRQCQRSEECGKRAVVGGNSPSSRPHPGARPHARRAGVVDLAFIPKAHSTIGNETKKLRWASGTPKHIVMQVCGQFKPTKQYEKGGLRRYPPCSQS